jgi:hypothetical protein
MGKKFNTSATKVSRKRTHAYVRSIEFEKIVPWSDTENITVREKIERQSGVIHWTKQVGRNEISFGGSCLDFMYLTDNNLMAQQDSTMLLQEEGNVTLENQTIEV